MTNNLVENANNKIIYLPDKPKLHFTDLFSDFKLLLKNKLNGVEITFSGYFQTLQFSSAYRYFILNRCLNILILVFQIS